jgi:hypothetical protein
MAATLRPRVPAIAEQIVAAVRAEVPEYDHPLEGEFGRLISGGVRTALDQILDLLGTTAQLPSTDIYAAMGRAQVDAGRTLDALQSAYRTGARVAWRSIVADVGEHVEPQAMYALAEAIFAYIDRLADASVAGYSEALAAREGSAQARRQALAELLLDPAADDEARREAAALAGWALPATAAVVALDHDDAIAVARRAPDGTLAAPRTEHGALLIVPDPDGPGRRRALAAALDGLASAIGPSLPPSRLYVSAGRAQRTLALGIAGAVPVTADEHRLELLLQADPALSAELVDAHLGPLHGLTGAARLRAETTLRAWLRTHGDVSEAAELLHVHPQTVRYRLAWLRELLGDEALDDHRRRLELALALLA